MDTPAHELASVDLQLPSGVSTTLFHGDLIGRLWSAALRLDDGRVSEAHAMISNRGRQMKLLALRGRFMVAGKTVTDVALRRGMQIVLAPGLELSVVQVTLPRSVLRVEADGVAGRIVEGVLSLYGGADPQIRSGWRPDADGCLWPTGEGWMRSGDPACALTHGSSWQLRGTCFRAHIEPGAVGSIPTQPAGLDLPLTLVARFDTVHVQRQGQPVLYITGRSARIVSELAVLQQPLAWDVVAGQLWGDLPRDALRSRWDMQLQRLRRKLRTAGVRTDLIRATGHGLVELVLGLDDVVVDET